MISNSTATHFLFSHNPHWRGKPFEKSVLREKLDEINLFDESKTVVSIVGPRRAGKSYLVFQLIHKLISQKINPSNILYLNLERPLFVQENKKLELFDVLFETYLVEKNPKGKVFIFLDEIQNIPNWESWVRAKVEDFNRDYKVVLTGSNSNLLSSELATLLTGRNLSYQLYPFNFREYLRAQKIGFKVGKNIHQTVRLNFSQKTEILSTLKRYLQQGGYPELLKIQSTQDKRNYLTEYVRSVIYKDIVPRFNLKDSLVLEKLMWYLINNNGSLYSYNSLSKTLDSNENTISQYLFYLKQVYLNFECARFSHSLKKQTKSQKKSYVVDHGLRQVFNDKLFDDSGKIVENLVFNTLNRKMSVGYFVDKNELDFVGYRLYQDLHLVNVSYTNDLNEREFKGFKQFKCPKDYKVKKMIITRDLLDKKDDIRMIPLWVWLLHN